jgi:8-oxo-dGTP diphosphatase
MQQEMKMTEYVCGFYFDHTFQQVALIWKNKPAWQKGKLNGIGGKIEKGELPITAMRREFHEETGVLHNGWVELITLTGAEWRVYFFCSVGKVNEFEYVETKEEEEVAKIEIERLLAWDFDHIPNLDWLIPMAINKLQFPEEIMSFESPSKEGNKEREVAFAEYIRKVYQPDEFDLWIDHAGNQFTTAELWNEWNNQQNNYK